MKILQIHTRYAQSGGEDVVVAEDARLLLQSGCEVELLEFSNLSLRHDNNIKAATQSIWNARSYQRTKESILRFKPDIVHVHNVFQAASPAVLYAAKNQHVPIVMTLHNYRLLCVNAMLVREGQPCEQCVGRLFALPGVQHNCYRGSKLASGAVAANVGLHRVFGTWNKVVDAYLTLTNFSRTRFIAGGLPADRLHVVPNAVADPGASTPVPTDLRTALFVGRLNHQKGVHLLLQAWRMLVEQRRLPLNAQLKFIGDGELRPEVEAAVRELSGLHYVGPQSREEVLGALQASSFLVLPSTSYEGLPMTILESYAAGRPVLVSGNDNLTELVIDGPAGVTFVPGDAADLAIQLEHMFQTDLTEMGHHARTLYKAYYSEKEHLDKLLNIYQNVQKHKGASVE